MANPERKPMIDLSKTYLPLGLVVASAIGGCSIVQQGYGIKEAIDTRFAGIEMAIHDNTRAINSLVDLNRDAWQVGDMSRWVSMFRVQNPKLAIPDPDEAR